MKKYFRPLVITSVVLIYLIIIAGAVVRMTGSGMGCPDWPKCFGYYIPPTEEAQIQWKANHEYQKGFIVILGKELRIATKDFSSTTAYNPDNWEPYTKHDYAEFNVWHTWIEYINRLVTVLSGIPILLMFIISLWFWKSNRKIPIYAGITIIAMAFQAWLGKIVVDSNLLPLRITVHMLVAFIILAILLYVLFLTRDKITSIKFSKTFKTMLLFSAVLTLVQVALGTQVRQYVDEQIKIVGEQTKSEWLNPPTFTFYVHRSFSILIVLINIWLLWYNKKMLLRVSKLNWVIGLIGLEALTGILMYYFDFPFLSQPLHLVLSSLLFGVQFYIILEVFKNKVIEA
ncbi:cytochrome c oxidase assembly protein subunit 15 [Aquimarina amphilecti]|uniref:Cytochrome c oxidase assembly protein subunit 15 n=1 Tax=Aquimarina amphilecti TaxID=1038014 RepID=A0A1H7PSH6_AQUAM|nr:COX15/CtaA family protein [Aquimarina amphilecti]SEL37997.1 cytochrome c oxidase assembly protein subunit 15 [Aquimarina amphilecti]